MRSVQHMQTTAHECQALERMANKARLCAGTVAGSAAAYLRALDAVWLPKVRVDMGMVSTRPGACGSCLGPGLVQLPQCNDQGVYVYSWHAGVFNQHGISTTMLPFATGPVATLNAPAVQIDMFGRVLNEVCPACLALEM